ncbi:LysR substrate-binding domain-containing protein [Rhizobium leguminosarum]|uniref:LysR substrate-binding domain-containing protein n=1 Tax=Rhizobium leguminosarum TaxID=384 RepID=UPI003F9CDF0D
MNQRQIEAFRAVMITGTVTDAAAMLRISQPAVSRLISALEHSSGLVLFDRIKKRLVSTADGQTFYREVDRSFLGLEALSEAARRIRTFNNQGHLRVASLPGFALGFLPRVFRSFCGEFPNVNISLITRNSGTVQGWIATQEFDIGLTGNAIDHPGLLTLPFTAAAGVCVMPAAHPLAARAYVEPKDFAGLPFIALAPDDPTRVKIDHVFRHHGVSIDPHLETRYSATICSCVLEGLGVAIVNPFTASDYIPLGLAARPVLPEITFQTYLVRPRYEPASRLTAEFEKHLFQCRDEELSKHARLFAGSGQ